MTLARSRTRETSVREPIRTESTHGRQRVRKSADKYYINPAIIPAGWVYQWKRYAILGQEDPAYMAELTQVGFSPVPAERHAGMFLPEGYKGAIIIGGQILMERPIELEQEAKEEDRWAADSQLRGSREQFGLAPKARGFEGAGQTNHSYVRQNTFARSQMETVNVPRPKHEIASLDD